MDSAAVVAESIKRLKNINFCALPSHILVNAKRTHTAAWMQLCAGFTDNPTAGNTSHTVSCWFSKTSLSTCAVFIYPWSAGLKVQSLRWMSMYFRTRWTLSQKDVFWLHHYNTPLSIVSEIQMCTVSLHAVSCTTVSSVITTEHQLIP